MENERKAAVPGTVGAVVGGIVCPHCGHLFSVMKVPPWDFGLTRNIELTVKCPACREIIDNDVPVPSEVQAEAGSTGADCDWVAPVTDERSRLFGTVRGSRGAASSHPANAEHEPRAVASRAQCSCSASSEVTQ